MFPEIISSPAMASQDNSASDTARPSDGTESPAAFSTTLKKGERIFSEAVLNIFKNHHDLAATEITNANIFDLLSKSSKAMEDLTTLKTFLIEVVETKIRNLTATHQSHRERIGKKLVELTGGAAVLVDAVGVPRAEVPKAEAPKTEAPKAEVPKAEANMLATAPPAIVTTPVTPPATPTVASETLPMQVDAGFVEVSSATARKAAKRAAKGATAPATSAVASVASAAPVAPWRDVTSRPAAPVKAATLTLTSVEIKEGINVPACAVSTMTEVTEFGVMYFVRNLDQFAIKYQHNAVIVGNIGSFYEPEEKNSVRVIACIHGANCSHPNCRFYHRALDCKGSKDIRNYFKTGWHNRMKAVGYDDLEGVKNMSMEEYAFLSDLTAHFVLLHYAASHQRRVSP